MEDAALIATLHAMRTNPSYQKAEAVRRQFKASGKSVAAMATSGEAAPEAGAIMLLIGTWEAIALTLSGVKDKKQIFEITPVSHMWHELSPAVKIFRASSSEFAHGFEKLASEHKTWLKQVNNNGEYETGDCHFCMHAMFG